MIGRNGVQRGPVTGQLVVGGLSPGGAGMKGHQPIGLKYLGQRVVRSNGQGRSGWSEAARTWPLKWNIQGKVICPPPPDWSIRGRRRGQETGRPPG